MAEVELHINISGAGKPDQVSKIVQAAMDMREPETRTVVPAGYRCAECWRDDGQHEPTCEFKSVKQPE